MSSSRANDSFEPGLFSELDESVHQIRLNLLKQFAARAAQVYKLLNQNSLLVMTSSRSEDYTSVYDPMMLVFANSFSAPVPPTIHWLNSLRKQFGIEPKNWWAADTSMREPKTWIKEQNESLYGFS